MRGIVLQDAAEAVVTQMYRIIMDCYDCSADCSVESYRRMSEYIVQGLDVDKSCGIKGVRMVSTTTEKGLGRPRVIVDYWTGDPVALLQATDNLLLRLGIEGAKAVVVEVVSHVVEGAIAGGAIGAAAGASTKNAGAAILAGVLGALAGELVGELLEGAILKLEAEKEYGVWRTYPVAAA